MNSKLSLANTIHSRSHERECQIYREAIESLDRTIDEIISECHDITKFTGLQINLGGSGGASGGASGGTSGGTSGGDEGKEGPGSSTLQEESLALLRAASKERDEAASAVVVLQQRLERVSNVLHCLGVHRDRVNFIQSSIQQGVDPFETPDNPKEEQRNTRHDNSFSAFTAAATSLHKPQPRPTSSGATSSETPSSGTRPKHQRIKSARFHAEIDGNPIAVDLQRRAMEQSNKKKAMALQQGTKDHGIDAAFEGLQMRHVEHDDWNDDEEEYEEKNRFPRSYFDDSGVAIEKKIMLPSGDTLMQMQAHEQDAGNQRKKQQVEENHEWHGKEGKWSACRCRCALCVVVVLLVTGFVLLFAPGC